MISVRRPGLDRSSEAFFTDSVATANPLAKRKRLMGAAGAVAESVAKYRELAAKQSLHQIPVTTNPFGGASPDDFRSLYGSFLQKTTAPGRYHYDALLLASDQNICPYCGTREAKTIDHFLPRRHYPHLSIAFENLVACCPECNQAKLDASPNSLEETCFHPYYENFPDEDWLTAEVLDLGPVVVAFGTVDGLPESSRIRHQFDSLNLARIYSFQANNELTSNGAQLSKLGRASTDLLQEHLLELAESAGRFPWSPWKSVLYQTLAEDEWFCGEGFELLS